MAWQWQPGQGDIERWTTHGKVEAKEKRVKHGWLLPLFVWNLLVDSMGLPWLPQDHWMKGLGSVYLTELPSVGGRFWGPHS